MSASASERVRCHNAPTNRDGCSHGSQSDRRDVMFRPFRGNPCFISTAGDSPWFARSARALGTSGTQWFFNGVFFASADGRENTHAATSLHRRRRRRRRRGRDSSRSRRRVVGVHARSLCTTLLVFAPKADVCPVVMNSLPVAVFAANILIDRSPGDGRRTLCKTHVLLPRRRALKTPYRSRRAFRRLRSVINTVKPPETLSYGGITTL